MRKLLLSFMVLTYLFSYGQMQAINQSITDDLIIHQGFGSKSTQCTADTNLYAYSKASGLSALSINNATSASGVAQYYNTPQAITISGLDFYAYKIDATGGISINVTVQVYLAGADSMPTGPALATSTVAVDTAFGGGTLSVLKKSATFTPVTMTQPYVVVMTNNSPNGVGVVFSSYSAGDGAQEWLLSVNIGGTWLRSYGINVGGVPMDADWLVSPYTSYALTADFTAGNQCLTAGPTVNFTNTSSPVMQDRMYSQLEYLGVPELGFTWNYGDGSPVENVIDGLHVYGGTSANEYPVMLTDTLVGWTTVCVHDTTQLVGDSLSVDFNSNQSGNTTSFTDGTYSTSGVMNYLWDFGDGNTSTQQSPNHTYAAQGNYTVCLTVVSNCGTADSTCHTVVVVGCGGPSAAFTVTNNDPSFTFTNTSVTTGPVSYYWSMGDGASYTTTDASHTFASNGNYDVMLIVTDSCGVDTLIQTITVATIGLNEWSMDQVQMYPIPASTSLVIKGDRAIESIQLMDMTGKLIEELDVNSNEYQLSVNELSNGNYLLIARMVDGSTGVNRFVVKH